jgi:branched-chain amino acid transport system substrate-binding protein
MLSIRRTKFEGVTAAFLLALAGACTLGGATAPPAKSIRIGLDLPLSGPELGAATPALDGVKFFVQTHPTLDGYRIELVTTDDGADPARGVSNVDTFLSDPTLVAMIGPFDGAVARKEIPVANAGGLAMVSPATSNPCLTRDTFLPPLLNPARTAVTCKQAGLPAASELRPSGTNNFFRMTSTDNLQGAAAADFVFNDLHLVRVAVISDHESYGQGLASAFSARLARLGGSVVDRLDATAADLSSFLSRAKVDGAQAVYYGGGAQTGCEIPAQMSSTFTAAGSTPLLGGDGIALDPTCVRRAGAGGIVIYATVPFPDAASMPAALPTISAFRTSFGSSSALGPYTMLAYDAAAVLYSAIHRAILYGSGERPTRAGVLTEVATTSGLVGVTGTLGFDRDGDTTNRVITVVQAPARDERAPWQPAGTIDYGIRLPY